MAGKFKLYLLFIKYDIKSQIRYPLDFIIQLLIWLIYAFIPLIGIYILFERFGNIGSWGMYHIGYSYGIIGFGYDLARMIGRGFDNFHKYTINGSLDALFIRPISLKLQILGNNFFLRRISGLINYTVVLAISISKLKDSFFLNINMVIITTIIIIIAIFILFLSLLLIYASVCIFTIQRNIISDLLIDNVAKISYLPLDYINNVLRTFLTYIVPIGIIAYNPLKNILFGDNLMSLMFSIFLSLLTSNIFLLLGNKFFNFSLAFYKSTGS